MEALAREKPNSSSDSIHTSVARMNEVEDLMSELLANSGRSPLTGIALEHLCSGGKRLRAFIGLRVAECFQVPRSDAIAIAAACELMHNATLIHDDLQDGDRFRRGQEAVWARYGTAQAVNTGDLLLMMPNLVADRLNVEDSTRWKIARLISQRAIETVHAQARELEMLTERELGRSAYEQIIDGKTGALMALPVELAALHADWDPIETDRLRRIFRTLGRLFQIQDDVLDLYGDKGRDRAANDLREGKVSAVVVTHLDLVPGDEAELIDVLERPRSETSDEDVRYWTRRFDASGARRTLITELEDSASGILCEPILRRHEPLLDVAESLIARTLAPIRLLNNSGDL